VLLQALLWVQEVEAPMLLLAWQLLPLRQQQ
jgi:hypothetical protein